MEIKLGQTTSVWDDLPAIQPPPITQIARLHGIRPADNQVVVMMRQEALLQIDEHGRSDTSVELGGLLLGNVYHDQERLFVDVSAAIIAKSDKNGPVHFTFTADAWAACHEEREAVYPDLKIVGWYHTHPDLGVFYSGDDVVVHTTAFSLAWHVGLVLDPVRNTVALFGWEEDEISGDKSLHPVQGWFEMASNQDGSVIPWQYRQGRGLRGMWRDAVSTSGSRFDGVNTVQAEPEELLTAGDVTFLIMLVALIGIVWWTIWVTPNRQREALLTTVTNQSSQVLINDLDAAGALSCPTPGLYIVDPQPGEEIERNTVVPIVGRADVPGLSAYVLQFEHRVKSYGWITIDTIRAEPGVEPLSYWQTSGLLTGPYRFRLAAIDAVGDPIESSACMLTVQIVDPVDPLTPSIED